MRRWPWLFMALIVLWATAQADFRPTATLTYRGKRITVVKTSPDDLGLAWIEDSDQGVRFIFYDPSPYRVELTLGEDTRAFGHLALVEQPDRGPSRIVLTDGEAAYDPERDAVRYQTQPADGAVAVVEGKVTVWGRELSYDNDRGLALLKGPLRFVREGETKLEGRAGRLVYRLDDGELWLLDRVVLRQGPRETEADQALVLEDQGLAYLYGDPVVSRDKDQKIQGRRVRYDLKTGDLWVLGQIAGEIQTP